MTKTLKLRIFLVVAAVTFLELSFLQLTHQKETAGSNIYQILDTILPLTGGFFGLLAAKKYSGWKSTLGQGIILVSLGLIAWALGQMAWTYYNIFSKIDVPYPSWADLGYLAGIPLWFAGVIRISSAMGVKYQLRKTAGKLTLILIPLVSIVLSYFLLIKVGRGGWPEHGQLNLKVFTDLAYPFGDVLVASVALTIYGLSKDYIGGRFKLPILFTLIGFIGMYTADFSLAYTTTKGTYYGGSWVDSIYSLSLIMIGLGLVLMDPSGYKKGRKDPDNAPAVVTAVKPAPPAEAA